MRFNNTNEIYFPDILNISSDFTTRKSVLHVIRNFTKTQSSHPKLNKFNKKLSDIIPIKRHIEENDEEDSLSIFKSSITNSTLESKRKWPLVELLPDSDDFKENSQYFDEFEKKEFPFMIHDIENESKVTKNPLKFIISYSDQKNNQTKDKPVGLRSLSQQIYPGISCEDGAKCVCRLPIKMGKTSSKSITTKKCTRATTVMNLYLPYEIVNNPTGPVLITTTNPKATTSRPPDPIDFEKFPIGFPVGVPMGVPMGVQMGVPMGVPMGMPVGYPAAYSVAYPADYTAGAVACGPGSPCYYQQNIHEDVPKTKKPHEWESDGDLYYDDEDDDDDDEKVCVYDEDSKKKKHKGDLIINVEYDIKENKQSKPEPNRHECRDSYDDLATNIFNDLLKSYDDTVIKNCYCCSASTRGIQFWTVYLFLLLNTLCYGSWVNGY